MRELRLVEASDWYGKPRSCKKAACRRALGTSARRLNVVVENGPQGGNKARGRSGSTG